MLNFDPYRWLAERGPATRAPFVASFAAVATDREDSGKSRSQKASATLAASATLRRWRDCIERFDASRPFAGYDSDEWPALRDDAAWLAEVHGEAALLLGWDAADLFGVQPGLPGLGGIADRLCGARSLVMDASRAHWRSSQSIGWYERGSHPWLPLLWEPDP